MRVLGHSARSGDGKGVVEELVDYHGLPVAVDYLAAGWRGVEDYLDPQRLVNSVRVAVGPRSWVILAEIALCVALLFLSFERFWRDVKSLG